MHGYPEFQPWLLDYPSARAGDGDRTPEQCSGRGCPERHREAWAHQLELMVELGMTPAQAIAAASSVAARAIRSADVGTIAVGKHADIAVWDGDPLEDISVLRSTPRAVYLAGARFV